ncbi:MAG: hypothetical protein V7767_15265 [Leeuwenhoekiella sp.]
MSTEPKKGSDSIKKASDSKDPKKDKPKDGVSINPKRDRSR